MLSKWFWSLTEMTQHLHGQRTLFFSSDHIRIIQFSLLKSISKPASFADCSFTLTLARLITTKCLRVHVSLQFIKFLINFCLFLAQSNLLANAQDDPVEGEEADVNVESSDVTETEDAGSVDGLKASPDVDITVLFTKPAGNGLG